MKHLLPKLTHMNARFCTLSTVDEQGNPWGAPVFYAWNAEGQIFWTSAVDAQHSRNIANNGRAYISLLAEKLDRNNPGNNGLYMAGTAREITDMSELVAAREILCARMNQTSEHPETFLGAHPRRVYVFTPQAAWCDGLVDVTGPDGGVHECDVRIEL